MSQPAALLSGEDGLQAISQILGIVPKTDPHHQDVALIALEFENTTALKAEPPRDANTQVGIAIFDTSDVGRISKENNYIQTFSFVVGAEDYWTDADYKFIFGDSVTIQMGEIVQCIESCIPPRRNIFLVGHGIDNELEILDNLGLQFDEPRPCGSIDTGKIAQQIFGHLPTLDALPTNLNCKHAYLHSAGNDANFALGALFLLAVLDSTGPGCDHDRMRLLEQAAGTPLSLPLALRPRADKRAEKRPEQRANSRRYQSLCVLSEEDKNKIRAEREARRLLVETDVDVDPAEYDIFNMETDV